MLQLYEYERSACHLTTAFVRTVFLSCEGPDFCLSRAVQICALFHSVVTSSVLAISITLTCFDFSRIACTSLYSHDLLNYF